MGVDENYKTEKVAEYVKAYDLKRTETRISTPKSKHAEFDEETETRKEKLKTKLEECKIGLDNYDTELKETYENWIEENDPEHSEKSQPQSGGHSGAGTSSKMTGGGATGKKHSQGGGSGSGKKDNQGGGSAHQGSCSKPGGGSKAGHR